MTTTDKHPTALRVAIAEKCNVCSEIDNKWKVYSLTGVPLYSVAPLVPNYPGSLDAMNEAEQSKIIGPIACGGKSLLVEYCAHLERIAEDKESAITATALQRAEAFVEACGLTERVKEIEESL